MSRRLTIDEIRSRLLEDSRLSVLEISHPGYDKNGKEIARVKCSCICGIIKTYKVGNIIRGTTYSCGCMQKQRASEANTKYPNAIKGILSSYQSMMGRCLNKNNQAYALYGGGGVKVCDEWVADYFSFEKWSINNGWREGLQIDKDIIGDGKLYSPSTCKWVTGLENNQARKGILQISYEGELLTLSEICRRKGVKRATIDSRIRNGTPFLIAINESIKDKNLNLKKNKKHETGRIA